jgi:hypothetical protein
MLGISIPAKIALFTQTAKENLGYWRMKRMLPSSSQLRHTFHHKYDEGRNIITIKEDALMKYRKMRKSSLLFNKIFNYLYFLNSLPVLQSNFLLHNVS